MRSFAELYDRAAARKGGVKALEAMIPKPKSKAALERITDDRWLAEMTKSVFQAGFVWRVVENKWADFERAFKGFDPLLVAYLSDEDVERLVTDPAIIRYHKKILSTREMRPSYSIALPNTAARRSFSPPIHRTITLACSGS